jgi:hypothetical protein
MLRLWMARRQCKGGPYRNPDHDPATVIPCGEDNVVRWLERSNGKIRGQHPPLGSVDRTVFAMCQYHQVFWAYKAASLHSPVLRLERHPSMYRAFAGHYCRAVGITASYIRLGR